MFKFQTANIILICLFLLQLVFPPNTLADWPGYRFSEKHSSNPPNIISYPLEQNWKLDFEKPINQEPAVDPDGNIYISHQFNLNKFNKEGQKLWSFPTGETPTTPVFDPDGNIYFGVSGCNPAVYSLDKLGLKRWVYSTREGTGQCGSNGLLGPLVMAADKSSLYAAVGDHFYGIVSLDLSGKVKWKRTLNFNSPLTPALDSEGNLYIGTMGYSKIYSLNKNGAVRWSTNFPASIWTSIWIPLIDDKNNIYFIANTDPLGPAIASFNSNGTLRWKYQAPKSGPISNMAYKDNKLFFSQNNSLVAINTENSSEIFRKTLEKPAVNAKFASPTVDKNGNLLINFYDTFYIFDSNGEELYKQKLSMVMSEVILYEDNSVYTFSNFDNKSRLYSLSKKAPTKPPLIFIPGIGGSEFQAKENIEWEKDDGHGGVYKNSYKKGEKIWVNEIEAIKPGNDDYFDVLKLKEDGLTEEAPLELTGGFAGGYVDTINFFNSNGYTKDKDFFTFAYDWRKDLSLTKGLLDQKIEYIKSQTGAEKVDIVAHSMGGLVARNYIQDPTKATNVRKLITLGTPYLGSVKALKTLKEGECLYLKIGPSCLSLNPQELKDIFQNLISSYQLIPSKLYYDFYYGNDKRYPKPLKDIRDVDKDNITGELDYNQTKQFLTNLSYNTALYNFSELFHDYNSNFDNSNGVELSIIAGSGIDTLGQIIEKYSVDFSFIKIPKTDLIKINGDNTVPLFSASLEDKVRNYSIKGDAKVYYTKKSHSVIPADKSVLNFVNNILNGNDKLPEGFSTDPYPLKGNLLSVHSPVEIHAYDNKNNHTGPLENGDYEANIPGSSYEVLGESKFIFLPEEGKYQIKFRATGEGYFDFKIRKYENNIIEEVVLYKNIPLEVDSQGSTLFDTTQSYPSIEMDYDGNNIIDELINFTAKTSGGSASDTNAPKTKVILEGQIGNENWYKSDVVVNLEGEDDLSGISFIEYSLDSGKTVNKYAQPFKISGDGIKEVMFRSVDQNGNEEYPQKFEIKIDKTAPYVELNTDPNYIWPPNKELVDVKILGNAHDNYQIKSTLFNFLDEYNLLKPTISNFGETIELLADREGNDKDGRDYKINVIVEDLAGNITQKEIVVKVLHDLDSSALPIDKFTKKFLE